MSDLDMNLYHSWIQTVPWLDPRWIQLQIHITGWILGISGFADPGTYPNRYSNLAKILKTAYVCRYNKHV